jgi:hypothetical protein
LPSVKEARGGTVIVLRLHDLSRCAVYESAAFETLAEAARVLLWRFHGVPPPNTSGEWKHDASSKAVALEWRAPSPGDQAANANEVDAVEDAAYAVAIAVAGELGFRVLGRVHHGSGADWLLVLDGEPQNDYYKLEVSGIAKVSRENKPKNRLSQKVRQGSSGDFERPGLAVVARFEDALILSQSWR